MQHLILLTGTVLVLLTSALPAAAQSPTAVVRLAGETRIETALAISADTYDDGSARSVVLARADIFPDALAGGSLAAVKDGPLLLTSKGALAGSVQMEIQRILAVGSTVYLLGGEAALSPQVAQTLRDSGYIVRRLAGANRYDTSLAIAQESAPSPRFITIAKGNDFPDALIGGSLATAFADGVMVLSNGEELTTTVRDYLDAHDEVAQASIGPDAAVAVPDKFNVAGDTPSIRSVVAAEEFYNTIDPRGVAVASVERFPDGLAGAPHAFETGNLPLLLTPTSQLPQRHIDYIQSLDASGNSYIYGGSLAVSDDTAGQLRAALEG